MSLTALERELMREGKAILGHITLTLWCDGCGSTEFEVTLVEDKYGFWIVDGADQFQECPECETILDLAKPWADALANAKQKEQTP